MADRTLHIGVDGRELMGRPTGVGRYLREILRVWSADPGWHHRVTIFVPRTPPPEVLDSAAGNVSWRVIDGAGAGTRWEQTRLPAAIRRSGADVFFAPGYTAPLRLACPFVVAVYDVSFWAHPEWFGWREGWRRRWLTRRAARRAAAVVTISEFSASEIVRWLGVRRERIVLAPPGAPPVRTVTMTRRPPNVLYVGSLFNRRRIPALVAGFAAAAESDPDARLVLVGDNRTRPHVDPLALAAQAGIADRVAWHAYVDDATLDSLYESARVFAFLSDYEGFAMTPMEALAHGVPSVLLDSPVAREVYGGAAHLVDGSPASVGAAIATLLADAAARERLLAAGAGPLQRYTWGQSARAIRAALERAASA